MSQARNPQAHVHRVTIYYEDTDLSGFVYHPNYLKYFERAREHLIGVDELAKMYRDTGVGFVVYRCDLSFKAPSRHGDILEIQTIPAVESAYRLTFDQQVFLVGKPESPIVTGSVEMVCIDHNDKLVAVPLQLRERLLELRPQNI